MVDRDKTWSRARLTRGSRVLELVAGAHEGREGPGIEVAKDGVPELCREGAEAEGRRKALGSTGLREQVRRKAVFDGRPEAAQSPGAELWVGSASFCSFRGRNDERGAVERDGSDGAPWG